MNDSFFCRLDCADVDDVDVKAEPAAAPWRRIGAVAKVTSITVGQAFVRRLRGCTLA
jgi:hypothetical protein